MSQRQIASELVAAFCADSTSIQFGSVGQLDAARSPRTQLCSAPLKTRPSRLFLREAPKVQE